MTVTFLRVFFRSSSNTLNPSLGSGKSSELSRPDFPSSAFSLRSLLFFGSYFHYVEAGYIKNNLIIVIGPLQL